MQVPTPSSAAIIAAWFWNCPPQKFEISFAARMLPEAKSANGKGKN
jgi:hypothetical protein